LCALDAIEKVLSLYELEEEFKDDKRFLDFLKYFRNTWVKRYPPSLWQTTFRCGDV